MADKNNGVRVPEPVPVVIAADPAVVNPEHPEVVPNVVIQPPPPQPPVPEENIIVGEGEQVTREQLRKQDLDGVFYKAQAEMDNPEEPITQARTSQKKVNYVLGDGERQAVFKNKFPYMIGKLATAINQTGDGGQLGSLPMDSIEDVMNDYCDQRVKNVMKRIATEDFFRKERCPKFGTNDDLTSCEKEMKAEIGMPGKIYYQSETTNTASLQTILAGIRRVVERNGLSPMATVQILVRMLRGEPRNLVSTLYRQGGVPVSKIWETVQTFAKPQISISDAKTQLENLVKSPINEFTAKYSKMLRLCYDASSYVPVSEQAVNASSMCRNYIYQMIQHHFGMAMANHIREKEKQVLLAAEEEGSMSQPEALNELHLIVLKTIQGQDSLQKTGRAGRINQIEESANDSDDESVITKKVETVEATRPRPLPPRPAQPQQQQQQQRQNYANYGGRNNYGNQKGNNGNRWQNRNDKRNNYGGFNNRQYQGNGAYGKNGYGNNNYGNRQGYNMNRGRINEVENNGNRQNNRGYRPEIGLCWLCNSTGSSNPDSPYYHNRYYNCKIYPNEVPVSRVPKPVFGAVALITQRKYADHPTR